MIPRPAVERRPCTEAGRPWRPRSDRPTRSGHPGPVRQLARTDLDAEVNRSRRGIRPISTKGRGARATRRIGWADEQRRPHHPQARRPPGCYRSGSARPGVARRAHGRRRRPRGPGDRRPGVDRGAPARLRLRDGRRRGGLRARARRHARRGSPGLRGGPARLGRPYADGPLERAHPPPPERARRSRAPAVGRVLRRRPPGPLPGAVPRPGVADEAGRRRHREGLRAPARRGLRRRPARARAPRGPRARSAWS